MSGTQSWTETRLQKCKDIKGTIFGFEGEIEARETKEPEDPSCNTALLNL